MYKKNVKSHIPTEKEKFKLAKKNSENLFK